MTTIVQVKILDDLLYKSYELPKYETEESAGMDLRTANDFILSADNQMLIPTGIAIHINDLKIMGVVAPRSGLGHKEQIILGNTVGIIDSDYQGELMLSMWNRGAVTRYFRRGDRIAQIIFMPIIRATFQLVSEFANSKRGKKGIGSTGVE